jgi:hypothetical protein
MDYIKDGIIEILTQDKLGGPVRNINESMIADFTTILDHLPAEKCEYIYQCIAESVNDEQTSGKHYNSRTKLKLAEIIGKHYNYKDN